MRSSLRSRAAFVAALLLPLAGAITPAHAASGPVSVLTTTSDLADLCRVAFHNLPYRCYCRFCLLIWPNN